MRLSKLSDRQLRRLIRNADVRFGEDYKKELISAIKELNKMVEMYAGPRRNSMQSYKKLDGILRGAPGFRNAYNEFNKATQSLADGYYGLVRVKDIMQNKLDKYIG